MVKAAPVACQSTAVTAGSSKKYVSHKYCLILSVSLFFFDNCMRNWRSRIAMLLPTQPSQIYSLLYDFLVEKMSLKLFQL